MRKEKLKERRKDSRYKTLPVTSLELSEIPETAALKMSPNSMPKIKTLRQRLEEIEKDFGGSSGNLADVKTPEEDWKKSETVTDGAQIPMVESLQDTEGNVTAKDMTTSATVARSKQGQTNLVPASPVSPISPLVQQQLVPLGGSTSSLKPVMSPTSPLTPLVNQEINSAPIPAVSSSQQPQKAATGIRHEVGDDEFDELVAINYNMVKTDDKHKRKDSKVTQKEHKDSSQKAAEKSKQTEGQQIEMPKEVPAKQKAEELQKQREVLKQNVSVKVTNKDDTHEEIFRKTDLVVDSDARSTEISEFGDATKSAGEETEQEDDQSRMSVSEKLSFFRQFDKPLTPSMQKNEGKKRFSSKADTRKQIQRVNTLPVTESEKNNLAAYGSAGSTTAESSSHSENFESDDQTKSSTVTEDITTVVNTVVKQPQELDSKEEEILKGKAELVIRAAASEDEPDTEDATEDELSKYDHSFSIIPTV